MALARGDQVDGRNAEILEDLRAEADFAPLAFAPPRLFMVLAFAGQRPRPLLVGDADRAFAQIDDDAALAFAHRLHDLVERHARSEDVGDHIFRMQPHRHFLSVANIAVNDRKMVHHVPGQHVGVGLGLAAGRVDVRAFDALHQRLLALAIGDQIGHRDLLQPMLFGKGRNLRSAHHRAVVIDQFGDHADQRQAGELAEVDGGLGMARAHQHPALARDQRKDMAGTHEIGRPDIAIGKVAHGQSAVVGRNAGGGAVLEIDAHSEGGGVGRIIVGDHRREVQPPRILARHRRADDTRGVAHNEGHLLGRAMHRRDDQIAFVLAAVIIHDNDDLTALERPQGFDDFLLVVRHDARFARF